MIAPDTLVPQTQTIAEVYATDSANGTAIAPDHRVRWDALITQFKKLYNKPPDFVARSPGRVNIIGEHIDYSLYDVLPTAISVDVLIAVKVLSSEIREPSVRIANANPDRFPACKFSIPREGDVDIDTTKHGWINYFKAGLMVALKFLRNRTQDAQFVPASLEILVDGNVPPGGGISSSAALVCASALAVVKANGLDVSKQDLFDMATVSERAVGVYSGGMDQAASIFSCRGFLLYTCFFPTFQVQYVPVPEADPEITFLIAQSFVLSNKADTAPRRYNLRVAECTLAAVVLAKLHDLTLQKDASSLGYSLRNFHQELMRKEGRVQDPLEYQLDSIILSATGLLTQDEGYTRGEIAHLLGIDVPELEQQFLSLFPVQAERFFLRQRALHCFKEARRVLDFKACLSRARHLDKHSIQYLGQLLNESQASCRLFYECTCQEVDEICEIALRAGAFGSRVTGAGWGGCTVHIIPQDRIEAVTNALKEEYYSKRFPDISEERLREAMVVSKPSNGSFVITGTAISEVFRQP